MNSEMQSAKWFWGGVALQLGVGYTVSFLVYQIGTLITTGKEVGMDRVDLLITIVLLVILGAAIVYIVKEKKKGTKCIGCPNSGNCAGCGGRCGNSLSIADNKE